jgi:predicted component of type VI protein secretion system
MIMTKILAIKNQIEALEAVLDGEVALEHVISDIWRKPAYNTAHVNHSLKWLRAELIRTESQK